MKALKLNVPKGNVSALLDVPKNGIAAITLAHGAGAGMNHPFMSALAASLVTAGFAVLRFQFPYMEAGLRRTDSPDTATATIAEAVKMLQNETDLPLFAGGKSFGARMTTTAAAKGMLPDLKGIVCFGFPLHPAGQPSIKRAEHLSEVPCPLLFLQGTRDELAELKLIRGVCKKLSKGRLCEIEGADHGFDVLKRSGRTPEQVLQQLAAETARFVRSATESI